MNDKIFFDTNIICYAFDSSDPTKRAVCERLLEQVMNNDIKGVISNQILGEVTNTAARKLKLQPEEIKIIVQGLITSEKWEKVNYTAKTVDNAIDKLGISPLHFWDFLIAETMKENGITEIVTENEKDFIKIPGIKVTNPFKASI